MIGGMNIKIRTFLCPRRYIVKIIYKKAVGMNPSFSIVRKAIGEISITRAVLFLRSMPIFFANHGRLCSRVGGADFGILETFIPSFKKMNSDNIKQRYNVGFTKSSVLGLRLITST